jgi:hypothetical protein
LEDIGLIRKKVLVFAQRFWAARGMEIGSLPQFVIAMSKLVLVVAGIRAWSKKTVPRFNPVPEVAYRRGRG